MSKEPTNETDLDSQNRTVRRRRRRAPVGDRSTAHVPLNPHVERNLRWLKLQRRWHL